MLIQCFIADKEIDGTLFIFKRREFPYVNNVVFLDDNAFKVLIIHLVKVLSTIS